MNSPSYGTLRKTLWGGLACFDLVSGVVAIELLWMGYGLTCFAFGGGFDRPLHESLSPCLRYTKYLGYFIWRGEGSGDEDRTHALIISEGCAVC